ncbi:MAG: bifunctional phosphopantothenoylcysteine decarboxylase/phosphopantothenate--cysteine ligase CoaBC [Alphaproteobacteria bacterium]|nr:bifunctional phosphopantothenoylcysteine decarboxylase/phosphopantothenate--cysteine ligase CoaBC [Alphaproteobacteria bacterium]
MTSALASRTLLLIISGGIAAYKSLDLIRRLKEEGAEVRCILTEGGAQFITPLSVSALSGQSVFTDLFSDQEEQRLAHIRLSREADLIIVAPATANMLAKMAHGLADNLASAVLLASNKPILIAPAMNNIMWQHPATQANIATLRARGAYQVGPSSGMLACGEQGAGRLAELDDILAAIHNFFSKNKPLTGRRALVTSGPTFEPIDPVRFLGNRSSGKQGHAIASALVTMGAEVTLVTGPTSLPAPNGVTTISIETAQDMLQACQSCAAQMPPLDIAICAAAVADWRPETTSTSKLKKGESTSPPALTLTENPDILATISQPGTLRPKLVIGFAAETDHVTENAQAKFTRKGCDWLLANLVGANKGFGQDNNQITLIKRAPDGAMTNDTWPAASKHEIAETLATHIVHFFEG